MKFRRAIMNTDDVKGSYQPGLQALTGKDRSRLSCNDTRKISGSLNLDAAVAQLYLDQPRWDYGIGIERTVSADRAIWVEVHPATAGEVQAMVAKSKWLKRWLEGSAPDLKSITEKMPFIWIASGSVSLQRNSRQARQLAMTAIAFPRQHYRIETVERTPN
ncbi:MAG: hypothetical protein ACM3ON_02930 [Chloroflexota bacterium]